MQQIVQFKSIYTTIKQANLNFFKSTLQMYPVWLPPLHFRSWLNLTAKIDLSGCPAYI
jgi:hypothetical protein